VGANRLTRKLTLRGQNLHRRARKSNRGRLGLENGIRCFQGGNRRNKIFPPTPENPLLPGDAPLPVQRRVGVTSRQCVGRSIESGRIRALNPPSDRVRDDHVVRCLGQIYMSRKQVVGRDPLPRSPKAERNSGGNGSAGVTALPEVIEGPGRARGTDQWLCPFDTITIPVRQSVERVDAGPADWISSPTGVRLSSTHGGDVYIV